MASNRSQKAAAEAAAEKTGNLSFQGSQDELRNQGEPSQSKKVCENLDNAHREELKAFF